MIIFFIQKNVTLAGISRTLAESATKRVSKYEKTRATLVGKPMAETRSLFRSWHRHWTGLLCRHDGTDDLQLQVVVTAGANAMAGVVGHAIMLLQPNPTPFMTRGIPPEINLRKS